MDRLYFVNSIGNMFILGIGYSVYLVAAFSVPSYLLSQCQ
jgi:hypothetical protein